MAELKRASGSAVPPAAGWSAGLAKKYQKGASIRSRAQETGRSNGFVHRLHEEAGVAMRGRGGSHRSPST